VIAPAPPAAKDGFTIDSASAGSCALVELTPRQGDCCRRDAL